jgi:hypothetical protein
MSLRTVDDGASRIWTLAGIAWAGASSILIPTMIVPDFKAGKNEIYKKGKN